MNEIQAFHFPSSIVMVDDNDAFLTNFGLKMSDSFSVDTFTDPSKAIQHIRRNYSNNALSNIQSIVRKEDNAENDYPSYTIEFDRIEEIRNNPDRSKVCSAIIVDYSMPIMSGLGFCEKLIETPIPKIMLTGHADFQLAVDAFNRGLISQFVVKDSPNMYEQLFQAITKCQNDFFKMKSYPITNAIQLAGNTMLESDDYLKCFLHVLSENKITEYYLLDAFGTFILISENGKEYYFQTVIDQQFDEYINIAENATGSLSLVSRLKQRSMLPLFVSEADRQRPVSEWEELLQPIFTLEGVYYMFAESATS